MPSVKHSRSNLIFGSLALALCLVSTTLAQDAQRDEPQRPKIIRKSGGVFQGSATRRVEPAYPPIAKAARVSGSVVVEVTADEEGNVFSVRAISGHPLLKDSAVAAAKAWKFAPTMLSGVPVKVISTITFNFELGDPKELEALREQARDNPNSPETHYKLADACVDRDLNDEAIEEYRLATQLSPGFASAYYQLGRLYEQLQRDDEALDAYRHAINVTPEIASANKPTFNLADQAYVFMASIYLRRAQYQDALVVLNEAGSFYPDLPVIHLYLARTYLEMGDKISALREHAILKTADPELARELLRLIEKKR